MVLVEFSYKTRKREVQVSSRQLSVARKTMTCYSEFLVSCQEDQAESLSNVSKATFNPSVSLEVTRESRASSEATQTLQRAKTILLS
jgi:hypothetical protein